MTCAWLALPCASHLLPRADPFSQSTDRSFRTHDAACHQYEASGETFGRWAAETMHSSRWDSGFAADLPSPGLHLCGQRDSNHHSPHALVLFVRMGSSVVYSLLCCDDYISQMLADLVQIPSFPCQVPRPPCTIPDELNAAFHFIGRCQGQQQASGQNPGH